MPVAAVVKAKLINGPVPGGTSNCVLMTDYNDRTYVVKLMNNPHGTYALTCELVMGLIAETLGVPSPQVCLIDIDKELIDISYLNAQEFQVTAGRHFASRLVDGYLEGAPRSLIGKVSNKPLFGHVIAHDILGNNPDRDNESNFLIAPSPTSENDLHFYSIDFGFCFGAPNWTNLPNMLTEWCGDRLEELCHEIRGQDPFQNAIGQVVGLTDSDIDACVDSVPGSWGFDLNYARILKDFLKVRRTEILGILQRNKAMFPNWA
jgi:hypothetical protein